MLFISVIIIISLLLTSYMYKKYKVFFLADTPEEAENISIFDLFYVILMVVAAVGTYYVFRVDLADKSEYLTMLKGKIVSNNMIPPF